MDPQKDDEYDNLMFIAGWISLSLFTNKVDDRKECLEYLSECPERCTGTCCYLRSR